MSGSRKDPLKLNQLRIPLLAFLESYNKNIPESFPRLTVKLLKRFQSLHPAFFKNSDEWSVDKHRKRIMDWLPSYDVAA